MSSYVPLWCKSNFSFLEGASHPDELVEEAHRLGMPALALTDRDGVYGAVRAHVKAREVGLKLIIGSQVSVADGSTIVLLAQDRGGYANLCRLLTTGRLRSEKGESAVSWEEVCWHAAGMLALWGGEQSLISDSMLHREGEKQSVMPALRLGSGQAPVGIQGGGATAKNLDSRLRGNDEKKNRLRTEVDLVTGSTDPDEVAGKLRDAFGDRFYGLLTRHRRDDEVAQEARMRERAKRYGFVLAAANEVLYHTPARRPLQDVLTAIQHGVPVASCGRRLKPNAEYDLKSPYAFARLFADDPAAFNRTLEIAERCNFSLNEIRYRYPSEDLPDGTTSAERLRRLTFSGAHWRYGELIPPAVVAQLEKELEIIEALDYPGYFLTMWEIVEFCRANGILCQGRGSAARPCGYGGQRGALPLALGAAGRWQGFRIVRNRAGPRGQVSLFL